MISALKQVNDYCKKSIFEFTDKDFAFDINDLLRGIEDDPPDIHGEIRFSKSLAKDLVSRKRVQLPTLKSSLSSLMDRLNAFENYEFQEHHARRRSHYETLIQRIDELLARSAEGST